MATNLIRQMQKADTYDNWENVANTFIPLLGELVVFLPDDNHLDEIIRFKIGNGETVLSDLPFVIPQSVLMTEQEIKAPKINAEEIETSKIIGEGFSITEDGAYIKGATGNNQDGELMTREALNYWWSIDSGDGTATPAQKEVEWNNIINKPNLTPATVNSSISGGGTNSVSNKYSFVFGNNNSSYGDYSIVFGKECTTSSNANNTNDFLGGSKSTIGLYNSADIKSSNTCFCYGFENHAQRDYAIAIGRNNVAYGNSSIALGRGNIIKTQYIDTKNENTSNYSSAIGYFNTITYSEHAHSLGSFNTTNANHDYTILLGNNLTSTKSNQFVIGEYNDKTDTVSSFAIGLGNATTGKNVFSITNDENTYLTTINSNLKVNGTIEGEYSISAEQITKLNIGLDDIIVEDNEGIDNDVSLLKWSDSFKQDMKKISNTTEQINYEINILQEGIKDYADISFINKRVDIAVENNTLPKIQITDNIRNNGLYITNSSGSGARKINSYNSEDELIASVEYLFDSDMTLNIKEVIAEEAAYIEIVPIDGGANIVASEIYTFQLYTDSTLKSDVQAYVNTYLAEMVW